LKTFERRNIVRRIFLVLSLWALALSPAWAAPRPFLDLDFEAAECSSGWVQAGFGGYVMSIDGSATRSGRQSLLLQHAGGPRDPRSFGLVMQQIPADLVAGQRIRFSGFIRTVGITDGYAGLWFQASNADRSSVVQDNLAGRGPSGTTGWTRYEIDLEIPADASTVNFGMLLPGNGRAWFDALSLEIGGQRWVDRRQPVAGPSAAAVSWLRQRAIRFDTPEAGHGFADLQPLKALIGDARIVSLGEQTHGTREFFQMKHRLTEFLASEMGFTLFAIEANMPEAYKVNEYVLTGQGDPRELLQGMYFWTWNTQEVLEMIEWMRELNQSGKGRIQFLGFDMQTPTVAIENAQAFLQRAEPAYVREADQAFDLVETVFEAWQRGERHPREREAAEAARKVFEHMSQSRGSYVSRLPREEVDLGIQNARVALQSAENIARITQRDVSMAANVEWILDQAPAGSKIVLWAHNAHVSKAPGWMGKFLADRYGDEQVVLGFAFDRGRYNSVGNQGLRDYEATPPAAGSVEAYLRSARMPRFVLDLRGIPDNAPSASWLRQPRNFRSIGSRVLRCASSPRVVSNDYDGLIWIERTSPSVLLPFD
jgi:erythromycin esterase